MEDLIKPGDAFSRIEKNVDRYPDDAELKQLLEQAGGLQPGKLKMAVLCLPGLQSFLGDIVASLNTKYEIQTCYSRNGQEIEAAVRWADVVWIEWVNHQTRNEYHYIYQYPGRSVSAVCESEPSPEASNHR